MVKLMKEIIHTLSWHFGQVGVGQCYFISDSQPLERAQAEFCERYQVEINN